MNPTLPDPHDLTAIEVEDAEAMLKSLLRPGVRPTSLQEIFFVWIDQATGEPLPDRGWLPLFSSQAHASQFLPQMEFHPALPPKLRAVDAESILKLYSGSTPSFYALNPCAECGYRNRYSFSDLADPEKVLYTWAVDSAFRFAKFSSLLKRADQKSREDAMKEALGLLHLIEAHIDPAISEVGERIRTFGEKKLD
jgi:hypothetical protein